VTSQSSATLGRLTTRAERLAIAVDAGALSRLADYFDLLQRWNEKINLTSLGDTDEAVDRLIMEPLVAARFLPRGGRLIDIGSGGGSPAIPLSVALGSSSLTMVESRSRKGAFLREALRSLELTGSVEAQRAEILAESPEFSRSADIVSVRAVRMTSQLSTALSHLLCASGVLALFSKHSEPIPDGFKPAGAHALVAVTQSFLHCFTPIR
jgi:16S rRNA (guanine527-N7)-methyltransferase